MLRSSMSRRAYFKDGLRITASTSLAERTMISWCSPIAKRNESETLGSVINLMRSRHPYSFTIKRIVSAHSLSVAAGAVTVRDGFAGAEGTPEA